MNHQHIKEWLFSDDPIADEQSQMVEEHLENCESCRQLQSAWSEVHQLISTTPDVEPMPGFLDRWGSRLIQERKIAQQRATWVVFASLTAVAVIIMILLGFQVFDIVRSPQQIGLVFLSRIAVFISYLYLTKDYISLISFYLPDIPIHVIILTTGITTLLCVIWLAAIKHLSSIWRAVQ